MTSTVPTNTVLAEHVAAIRALGKQTVENVIEIGRRLTECKKIVGHGNWGCWLDREFAWSERSGQRFMQVFKLAKTDKLAELDLPVSALYLLAAAPETVRKARDEIIERAKAGESVSVAEVKRTIIDTRGRQQPARARGPRHRCWQCGSWGIVGEVKERSYANFEDVWLHDPCVTAFEANLLKESSARAIDDDVGPDSVGEAERLRARTEELERENHRLRLENIALRSEIEELRARLGSPPPADDGLDIPPSLRRAAP